MPLHGVVEVLVHFADFRNVDLYHQGLYQLRARLSVPQRAPEYNSSDSAANGGAAAAAASRRDPAILALPYNWFTQSKGHEGSEANHAAGQEPPPSEPSFHSVKQACISDTQVAFYSRSFLIRYCEEEIPLGDFCQFRLELPSELLSDSSETVIACDVDLLYAELNSCNVTGININAKSEKMLKEATHRSDITFEVVSTVRLLLHHVEAGIYEYVPVVFDETHFSTVQMLICATLSDFRFRLPPPPSLPASASSSESEEPPSTSSNQEDLPPIPTTLEEFLKQRVASDGGTSKRPGCEYMDIMEKAYSHLESFFCELASKCLKAPYKETLAEKLSIPHKKPVTDIVPKDVGEIMSTMNVLAVSSFELWHRLLDILPKCIKEACMRLRKVWERNTIEMFSHLNSCVTETVDSTRDLAFPLEDDIWEAHSTAAERVREKFASNPPEPLCRIEDTTELAIPVKEGDSSINQPRGMSTMPIIFEQRYSCGSSTPSSVEDDRADSTPAEQVIKPIPMPTDPKPYQGVHLIVLVHGFQGNSYDMRLFKDNLACVYPGSLFLCSTCNEEDTEGNIDAMGQRLADEVACYVADWCPGASLSRLSFVSHSLGGLIARAALPYLADQPGIAGKLYTFLSLSAPHLGYLYNSNKLIEGGIWVLKRWRKSECLQELTMADSDIPQECYLYRLAMQSGQMLPRFQHVVLVSSCQDQYAGFDSARIEVSDKVRQEPTMGSVYTEMARSLVSGIAPEKLIRLDVNFYLPERNLDSFIGRAAHIQFIENQPLMKMIIHNYCLLFQ